MAIPAARFKTGVAASSSLSPCHVLVSLQSYPAQAKNQRRNRQESAKNP
jgi:hypothetical protein